MAFFNTLSFKSNVFYAIFIFMSYEVTATRRRPQKFEDMIGQDFVVTTLQKSIEAGKIAPAYLFSGPRGCGKTSSARILAKALNCEKGPTGNPCGECQACIEITRGSSFDVIEIDGASNTSVNDIRQIKEEVLFPPNSCTYKIYIIDEVHMLSTSAFNALLKTIEEPPPYVVFIFATTELHKVPATIKSRCQHFNFRLVSVDLLKTVLSEAAAESGVQAEDEALFWIAREATGSVRDAYTLFDQVLAFSDGHINFEKIRDKLGLVGVDRLNPLVDFCVEKNLKEALLHLDEILQAGVSVEQCTVDLANYFRNVLLIKSGIQKEALIGQKIERFSSKLLNAWSVIQIERALGICLQLFKDIRYSLDVRYELELAISRLAWITDYVSSDDMKKVITQARNLLLADSKEQERPFDRAVGFYEEKSHDSDRSLNDSFAHEEAQGAEQKNVEHPFEELKKKWGVETGEPIKPQSTEEEKPRVKESENAEKPIDQGAGGNAELLEVVSFVELQEKMIEYFVSQKNMLSATMGQTKNWALDGDLVSFSTETPYIYNALENEKRILQELICSLLGKEIKLQINLEKVQTEKNASNQLPERVELIRQMFRGSVV